MLRFKRTLITSLLLFSCISSAISAQSSADSAVKAPVKGLVDMGDITFYNNPKFSPNNDPTILAPYGNAFQATVINVTWAELQPNGPNTPLATNNALDQALTAIQNYNTLHPAAPLVAKLRVWGGFTAPQWAKQLNGGPMTITATKHGGAVTQQGTIGLWWESNYLDYWQSFLTLLADKYDGVSLIQEISVTSCASATDEPFISWSDPTTIQTLLQNNYSDAAQQNCLLSAMDHYASWNTTLLDFPFSPFSQLDTGTPVSNTTFTKTIMENCATMGNCVMSNQGLNQSLNNNLLTIYGYMNQLYNQAIAAGTPAPFIDFQTASPLLINWCGAITTGVQYHAQSIELWPSTPTLPGFTSMTPQQVTNLAYLLAGNPAYNPSLCP